MKISIKFVLFAILSVPFISSCSDDIKIVEKSEFVTVNDKQVINSEDDVYLYSSFKNNQYCEMLVHRGDSGIAYITTSSISVPENPKYRTYLLNGLSADEDGVLTIPDDGEKYWVISFDDIEPMVSTVEGGSSFTIHCQCDANGFCTVKGAYSGSVFEYHCGDKESDPCQGNCDMTVTGIVNGGPVNLESAVFLSAAKIEYNGVLYQ